MKRRDLLKTGAVLATAQVATPAFAQTGADQGMSDRHSQVPAIWRMSLGSRTITVVSDGYVAFEDWHTPNIDTADRAQMLSDHFLPTDIYQGSVNSFIIEDANGVTLIDGGTGDLLGPPTGHLVNNMRAAGFQPEDVTTLLATHLHPDHVGGIYTSEGAAVFPNAELVVSEDDHRFWTDAGMQAQAPEAARFLWDIAGSALGAYSGRVRRFQGASDVLPGISPVALPGHTPGQCGFQIADGDETLLIWADLIHVAPLQLRRPDIVFAFDVDPELAVTTRQTTLDMVATDGIQVAGMHLPFPGTGHIVRDENAFALVPARWGYDH